MPQALGHAGGGLALPDLYADAQLGDLHRADAAVFVSHALHAGVGGLLDGGRGGGGDRAGTAGAFDNQLGEGATASATDPVVAGTLRRSHSPLEPGQNGALHHAGHGGAEPAIFQLGYVIVHGIFAAVVVLGAVDVLIAGAAVVVLGRGGGKAVVRRERRSRHEQRHHCGQCQSRNFSDVLQTGSSFSSVGSNSCQSAGRSRRTV